MRMSINETNLKEIELSYQYYLPEFANWHRL